MTSHGSLPRKRRTREHIIADQSVNYVERFIIDEGHTAERIVTDYGYDLNLKTYDEGGYVEPGAVYIQLKASEELKASGEDFVFDLDVRDYNLWLMEPLPVVLILFDASQRRGYWLDIHGYFRDPSTHQPRVKAKSVRVRVPKRNKVSRKAIARMRMIKRAARSYWQRVQIP